MKSYIGIYDDAFGVNANLKLLLSIIFFTFFLFINEDFVLENIIISSGQIIHLGSFSIPFTIFCLVIFQNAFNMYDGINLQNLEIRQAIKDVLENNQISKFDFLSFDAINL